MASLLILLYVTVEYLSLIHLVSFIYGLFQYALVEPLTRQRNIIISVAQTLRVSQCIGVRDKTLSTIMGDLYSNKIGVPQYIPSGKPVGIKDLMDDSKYQQLKKDIMESYQNGDITKDEADFLVMAATRHIKFNYSKIADYYCVSLEKTQRLMEQSALVLLDLEDAVLNQYTYGLKFIQMLKDQSLNDKNENA